MFSLEMFSKELSNNNQNSEAVKEQVFTGLKTFLNHHNEIKKQRVTQ